MLATSDPHFVVCLRCGGTQCTSEGGVWGGWRRSRLGGNTLSGRGLQRGGGVPWLRRRVSGERRRSGVGRRSRLRRR